MRGDSGTKAGEWSGIRLSELEQSCLCFPKLSVRVSQIMESHEIIKDAVDNTGPKEVAAELGLSLSLIYKWAQAAEEDGSGSRNPLDRVLQLVEITEDHSLIQWLCVRTGGYYVHNRHTENEEGYEVIPATNEIVQQFADLLQVITQAALDQSINEDESERIRAVWEDLKRYTEGFVRCCEDGDFEKMLTREKPEEK